MTGFRAIGIVTLNPETWRNSIRSIALKAREKCPQRIQEFQWFPSTGVWTFLDQSALAPRRSDPTVIPGSSPQSRMRTVGHPARLVDPVPTRPLRAQFGAPARHPQPGAEGTPLLPNWSRKHRSQIIRMSLVEGLLELVPPKCNRPAEGNSSIEARFGPLRKTDQCCHDRLA